MFRACFSWKLPEIGKYHKQCNLTSWCPAPSYSALTLCVDLHAYTFVCTHLCVYTFACLHTCMLSFTCMCLHICVFAHLHVYTLVCIVLHACVCIFARLHICVFTVLHAYVYTFACLPICMSITVCSCFPTCYKISTGNRLLIVNHCFIFSGPYIHV